MNTEDQNKLTEYWHREGVGGEMSIRDTLLAAAEIIGEDADGLLASHGINGQWIEIDDSDMDAHTEYDRMIAVRDELLRLAGANLEVIEFNQAEVEK